MRHAAAIPAVALLAGSALGLLASLGSVGPMPGSAASVLLVSLVLPAFLAWRRGRAPALAAIVALAFFAGGAALAARAWHDATRSSLRAAFDAAAGDDFSIAATIDGVLDRDASAGATGVSLSIAADSLRVGRTVRSVDGGILVTVAGASAGSCAPGWRAGRRVRLPVSLRRPLGYRDPDVPAREDVLARQGIALVATAKSGMLVEVIARGAIWAEAAAALRQRVRGTVARTVARHSARSAAIVNAIVIGDRAGLDPDVQRSLQEAGTYHVIAISGGNIAILAGVLLAGFRLAGVLGRAAMLVAAIGLIAYGYLVGGGASVDRATMMAVVYFGTRAWDHRTAPLNTLAVVAALLTAAGPLAVADPAFLLTFGATLAILLVMPIVPRRRRHWIVDAGIGTFASSIAAEVMLFPVAAVVFSRVTVAGLALNFLAIPLMAVAQLAGMALVPVADVSEAAGQAVGWIAHLGAGGLIWSARLVRFAPAAAWRVPPPHWIAIACYYAAIGVAWVGRGRVRAVALVCAAAAVVWIALVPWRLYVARGDGRLHVTFIDVGQGDATAIRFPHGAVWLVDAGGVSSASTFDVGDRVVAPVLRRMGVRRLDRLVVTHGDPDHTGGAPAIVREFRPREVWEGVPVVRYPPNGQLADQARAAGVAWRSIRAGEELTIDGVRLIVRHPPPADWERQRVRNDDSVVLELVWGGVSVLLPGDIGRAVEPAVARTLDASRVRIVKAPHHGSGGSSGDALVGRTRPSVAIVSVGRGNPFGHPAPEVIDRYRRAGAAIFRTDEDGAIFLETDGTSVSICTFNGRSYELSR